MNSPYIQWTSAKKDEPFDSNNLVLPFISLAEHNHLISQLEEKLRIAELKLSKFKVWGTDGCKSCEGGRITMFVANQECIQCNPQSYEALAAIKEKK